MVEMSYRRQAADGDVALTVFRSERELVRAMITMAVQLEDIFELPVPVLCKVIETGAPLERQSIARRISVEPRGREGG